jgi:hypothetical protein
MMLCWSRFTEHHGLVVRQYAETGADDRVAFPIGEHRASAGQMPREV